jgi:hypothetical protein
VSVDHCAIAHDIVQATAPGQQARQSIPWLLGLSASVVPERRVEGRIRRHERVGI